MKAIVPTGLFRLFFVVLLGAAGLTFTACQKDDSGIQDYSGVDQGLITQYLTSKNITTAQKQPSGLYFLPVATNPNATKVAVGATVSVLYTAHLLDVAGTVFDASSRHNNVPVTFTVGAGQLIPGFEEGISLMHIGDKAELIIPSGLAYGASTANGLIPANSVVRFEVEVVDYIAVDDNLITTYLASKNITTAQKQPSGLYFLPVTTNPNAVQVTTGATVSVGWHTGLRGHRPGLLPTPFCASK